MFSVKTVFLFVVLYLGCIVMANEDNMKDDNIDRGSRSDRGSLWFGPRLGKRSLNLNSEDNRQSFSRLLEAADDLKHYYDQLSYYEPQADEPLTKDIKNVIFTPRRSLVEDKRYDSMDFLPRLGRRLAAQIPPTPPEQDRYHVVVEPMGVNLFTPRLGRNVNFSPRLGRELSNDTILLSYAIFGNGQITAESEEFWNLAPKFAAPKLTEELSHLVFRKDNRQRNRTETAKENFKPKGIYNKEDDKATPIAYKRAQDEELEAVENIEDEVQDNGSARRGNDGYKQDETYVDENYYYENRKDKDVEEEENDEGDREAEEYEASEEEFQERAAELVSSPKKIVQVNMKELVERVKKKILMDLKREAKKEEQIEKTRSSRPSNNHRIRLTTTNYKRNSQRKVRPPHLQNKKKAKPVKSPQYALPNRQRYKKIQNKKVSQEHIEQSDLFDTVNLQAKDKRDQYKEYVIPPKEYDEYESEETVTNQPTNNRGSRNYKNPVEPQKPRQLRISDTQTETDHEKQNYDSRQTRPSGHYLQKIRTISQYTYQKDNIVHQPPHSDAAETTTDIFEDDSVTKRRTTQELKARTENIGGPSEEVTIVKNHGVKDSKKDHLGTDIPTRQTYKMSSPDYYHKLPRVAEKYNFEEPIPEKDREEEDTRQIYKNPGAMINKKFKIE